MRNHTCSKSFQEIIHMQKESCVYNRLDFFRWVFEYPWNQLSIYLFHYSFKRDSWLYRCQRKWLIFLMKLHKLVNIVELVGMYVVELKNFLLWVLYHCFVESRVLSKNISFYFVLFTILSFYYVDLDFVLHRIIIIWLGNL